MMYNCEQYQNSFSDVHRDIEYILKKTDKQTISKEIRVWYQKIIIFFSAWGKLLYLTLYKIHMYNEDTIYDVLLCMF